MIIPKQSKAVVRCDVDGNYIDEFSSFKEAATILFPDKKNAGGNIGRAIIENRKAYGYWWYLKKDYEEVKYAES